MSMQISVPSAVAAAESPDRVRADSIEIANLYESGPTTVSPSAIAIDSAPRPRDGVTRASSVSRIVRASEETLGSNVDFLA